jgi:hypothetical protein
MIHPWKLATLLTSTILLTAVCPAGANLIVVSGDSNTFGALVGDVIFPDPDPGNQRFMTNVLGDGDQVLISGTSSAGNLTKADDFYDGLAGVTSTIDTGLVAAADLVGVDLFIGITPETAYSASEIAALSAFSDAGGTIFLSSERSGIGSSSTPNLNALLTGLASPMQIVPATVDPGAHTATGSQIATNSLTTGVTTFSYAATSLVTGGTGLFFTEGGSAFVASTGSLNAVPEPTPIALLGFGAAAGLGIAGLRRRKQRRA